MSANGINRRNVILTGLSTALLAKTAFAQGSGTKTLPPEGSDTKTAAMMSTAAYEAEDFTSLLGMAGFSDTLLSNHFKLYQGYVKNTNLLSEKLVALCMAGQTSTPEYAELKRRFGFEFNGMRLHEYYFSNLGGTGVPDAESLLSKRLAAQFTSTDAWKTDFVATGSMRGIGWTVLYEDTQTGRFFNCWINEHETGHLAGCSPILVMDVFEHAFITDYGLDRKSYIEAFFKTVDWETVSARVSHA